MVSYETRIQHKVLLDHITLILHDELVGVGSFYLWCWKYVNYDNNFQSHLVFCKVVKNDMMC
jgi:hypothetical protein